MATIHTIRKEPLTAAIKALVRGFGSEPREVDLVTENLIQANLTGHDSHGIGMLPKYSEAFVEGGLKANAHVKTTLDGGAMLRLDGQAGFGQVIGQMIEIRLCVVDEADRRASQSTQGRVCSRSLRVASVRRSRIK